jgi:hypothetical protein
MGNFMKEILETAANILAAGTPGLVFLFAALAAVIALRLIRNPEARSGPMFAFMGFSLIIFGVYYLLPCGQCESKVIISQISFEIDQAKQRAINARKNDGNAKNCASHAILAEQHLQSARRLADSLLED